MCTRVALVLSLLAFTGCAFAQSSRFIVDDDAYEDKVTAAASKLLASRKLLSQETLRAEVKTKGFAAKLAPPAQHKLPPPDLYEKLRQSTFAVGLFYKCPDCGEWHFNSSTGFAVGEGGILCTCCHVLVEPDEKVKESYVVAADAEGHVFPVRAVLAADTESDTCFLRIDARGLQPLPFRFGARAGERVYCLSHPGGYYFMFTEGMIARLNRRPNDALDDHNQSSTQHTRPVLFLNVTAEFAPGSSGAPIVDEAGNVVGQVASIVDAGEPEPGDEQTAASPSVAIRFCTAAEEILRLTDPHLSTPAESPARRHNGPQGKPKSRKLRPSNRPCLR
jgi:S1-C subfamily serine protease